MSFEIKKQDWPDFFDALGTRRFEWATKIEVMNSEMGDQVLSDGLPLNGITVETHGDRTSIDISVLEDADSHQTHNILNPKRVAFLKADESHSDVVDIEEEDGTKTLITFIVPMGVLVGYQQVKMIATVG